MRIGVIADTHGLVREQALAHLRGCEHILHAGDIGKPEVIEVLRGLAPVTAIRGNVDRGPWAESFARTELVEIAGRWIYLIHDRNDLDLAPDGAGIDVVISGHSHRPGIEHRDDVLYLNPGSAGPRRFSLPITLAELDLSSARPQARIVELAS